MNKGASSKKGKKEKERPSSLRLVVDFEGLKNDCKEVGCSGTWLCYIVLHSLLGDMSCMHCFHSLCFPLFVPNRSCLAKMALY